MRRILEQEILVKIFVHNEVCEKLNEASDDLGEDDVMLMSPNILDVTTNCQFIVNTILLTEQDHRSPDAIKIKT